MDTETKQRLAQAVGKAIAKHRKILGMTQADLAERLNMSNDAISRLERGNIVPSVIRLFELAEIFDCDAEDLLNGGSNRNRDLALRLANLMMDIEEEKRLQMVDLMERIIVLMVEGD